IDRIFFLFELVIAEGFEIEFVEGFRGEIVKFFLVRHWAFDTVRSTHRSSISDEETRFAYRARHLWELHRLNESLLFRGGRVLTGCHPLRVLRDESLRRASLKILRSTNRDGWRPSAQSYSLPT